MSGEVYITRLSKFLPNNPVSNEEMEEILGPHVVRVAKDISRALQLREDDLTARDRS